MTINFRNVIRFKILIMILSKQLLQQVSIPNTNNFLLCNKYFFICLGFTAYQSVKVTFNDKSFSYIYLI